MQLALPLPNMPLTPDAQKLLDRMAGFYPSGIGAMTYSGMMWQLSWPAARTSKALQELLDRGMVWGVGICGEYYVEENWPKADYDDEEND